MIGLRIGAAELAEIEAGAPAVVLAPGLLLPHAPPLVPLVLKEGVLARPGADISRTLPLPGWARPLALVAREEVAERLLPLLPAGLPVLPDAAALLGRLAEALREARAAREAAEAERDMLRRALALPAPPLPRLVQEVLPAGASAAPPLAQPLGRPAEGLCRIEIHLADPGAGGPLRIRLRGGARLLGAWHLPAAALAPGWLVLDLPEPAAPGPAEAVLEVASEGAEGAAPTLSLAGTEPGAALALRSFVAPAGWSALPQFFQWHAVGGAGARMPLPVPAEILAAAEVAGGRAELVGAGEELPRLLVELPARGEALLRLPPLPAGPADLLRARLVRRDAGEATLGLRLVLAGEGGDPVESGWRDLAAGEPLDLALPLPAGAMPRLSLSLRHGGEGMAVVELAGLAVMEGAAGAPRLPLPAGTVPAAGAPGATPQGPRPAVSLPGAAPLEIAAAWRGGAPAPRAAVAGPGGVPAAPAAGPVMGPAGGLPGGVGFQDLKLNQHLANAEGTYRHLDIALSGLVSGGGLWRQVRLKLFERRGTAGLEFREMKGWPQMFDVWPVGGTDNFGPFWRLQTEATAAALAALVTPHDRALVAALLEVLPDLAARGAAAAGLPGAEAEAWAERARRLARAVDEARGIRARG